MIAPSLAQPIVAPYFNDINRSPVQLASGTPESAMVAPVVVSVEPPFSIEQQMPSESQYAEFQTYASSQVAPVTSAESWVSYELQNAHIIHVGDQLEISFPYRPAFNQLLNVRDDGVIAPTLVPAMMAAGRTPEIVQEELRYYYRSVAYNAKNNSISSKSRKYLLQVGDEIDVRFSAAMELSQKAVVRPDGRITMSRIGEILAEGQSPEELQTSLITKYKPLVPNPELVVIVQKYNENLVYVDGEATPIGLTGIEELTVRILRQAPRLVYITGEVGNPSAVAYLPGMTAHRAIVTAGGFKRTGARHRVVILRRVNPVASCEMMVNLQPHTFARKMLWKDGGYLDVPLRPDDVVVIPKTTVAKVQDFLDQYVYDMFPLTRNTQFTMFYDTRGGTFNAGAVSP